jgi:hypothetical protein
MTIAGMNYTVADSHANNKSMQAAADFLVQHSLLNMLTMTASHAR